MRSQFYFPFSVVLNVFLIILLIKCCSEPNETRSTERTENTTVQMPDTNKVQGGKLIQVSAHKTYSPNSRPKVSGVEDKPVTAEPANSTLGICDSVTDYRHQYSDSNLTVDVSQKVRGEIIGQPDIYYRLKVPLTITRTITEREFVSADHKSLRLYAGGTLMRDSSGVIKLGIAGQFTFPSFAVQTAYYPSGKTWQVGVCSRLFRK